MSERPDSIHDYSVIELILIAFLGGVAFALGVGVGGYMLWWAVSH